MSESAQGVHNRDVTTAETEDSDGMSIGTGHPFGIRAGDDALHTIDGTAYSALRRAKTTTRR